MGTVRPHEEVEGEEELNEMGMPELGACDVCGQFEKDCWCELCELGLCRGHHDCPECLL
jgi:hypothetical protein